MVIKTKASEKSCFSTLLRYFRKDLVVWVLLLFSLNLFAQKEDYNWVLSNGIKINFNQQPPEVTTDIPPFYSPPNCASMSDKNGNLLFYINRNKVYNFNHQIISPYIPLFYRNQVNIVPYPTETKKYFWINSIVVSPPKLKIHTIDMNVNYGKGAVNETYTFNIDSNFAITKKGNSQDYWLIKIFDDRTEAYPLTDKGIINSPVISYLNIDNDLYEYKLSPDMTKIFLHSSRNLGVFDIDIQTGEAKNYRTIYTNPKNCYFLFEFSRNGEFIYIAKQNKNNYETTISQFSMHALSNETDFLNVEIVLLDTALSNTRQLRDIQLAPDNKIYLTFDDYYLWAIENIDSPAPACTVNPKSLWLKNKKSGTYLPNYFYYHINFNYLKSCNMLSFNYLGLNADTYLWHFGDGTTSTEQNPTHTYATAGTYTLTLTVTYNNNTTQTITKDIEISGKPQKPIIEHE